MPDAAPQPAQSPPAVLITGASSGIGAACAAAFADHGWAVRLNGRDAAKLEAVRASLAGEGHTCCPGDVTEWAEDPRRIPALAPVDALVWSAGVCELAPASVLSEATLLRSLRANLVAPMVVTGRLFRKKILREGARVVWVGSEAARRAGEGFAVYAATKGGLASAAAVFEREFARRNVSVTCVEPGTVDTPMTQSVIDQFGGLQDGHAESMRTADSVAREILALCQNHTR